ncbi:MAG: prolyl oligopeptidase family serine peptidase [Cyclobacteriaceae bacterium]|nr:prolyl oligopeptidase family serine peptidase [Cyclobacteriaceae bacterium]
MKYLLLLVALSFSAKAQDLELFQKLEFNASNGLNLPYRLLLPEKLEAGKKYPVILLLHGAGERGSDNEKQLVHGAKLFATEENRKNFPAIVIAPQCPAEGYWASVLVDRATNPFGLSFDYSRPITQPLEAAIELVKKILKEQPADKSRVYITGLSMGGMGTFEAIYRFPKLFAAAAPICGGGDTKLYSRQAAKVPFWIFHGDADAVIDVKESRAMVEKLKSLQAKVKYTEYGGVNHNSWDNAFAEPDFLKWLLEN